MSPLNKFGVSFQLLILQKQIHRWTNTVILHINSTPARQIYFFLQFSPRGAAQPCRGTAAQALAWKADPQQEQGGLRSDPAPHQDTPHQPAKSKSDLEPLLGVDSAQKQGPLNEFSHTQSQRRMCLRKTWSTQQVEVPPCPQMVQT